MRIVEDAASAIAFQGSGDDALDLVLEYIDDWFRGGATDAVAELLEIMAREQAPTVVLVCALTATHSHCYAWTDALRGARANICLILAQREPDRIDSLLSGIKNEDPGPEPWAMQVLEELTR